MRWLSLILLTPLFLGCVNSKDLVSERIAKLIPEDSKQAIVIANIPPESLYTEAQKHLLKKGYRISNTDDEIMSITTEGTGIGQSTLTRFTLIVEKTESGSQMSGRAEWMPGSTANVMASAMTGAQTDSQWEQAAWTEGRPQRAYAALINFMETMPSKNFVRF